MENKQFTIQGYFESAKFTCDLQTIRKVLEGSSTWAAGVLEHADTKRRIVEAIQRYNRCRPCRVIKAKNHSLIAVAPVGKKQCLAYRLEADHGSNVRITPLPFLVVKDKVGIAFMLTLAFVLPVLLSPFVWRRYEQNNLRMSRYYLISFCHYLESRLS